MWHIRNKEPTAKTTLLHCSRPVASKGTLSQPPPRPHMFSTRFHSLVSCDNMMKYDTSTAREVLLRGPVVSFCQDAFFYFPVNNTLLGFKFFPFILPEAHDPFPPLQFPFSFWMWGLAGRYTPFFTLYPQYPWRPAELHVRLGYAGEAQSPVSELSPTSCSDTWIRSTTVWMIFTSKQ